MEWIVTIEGKRNRRILVRFQPLTESIDFIGQYKPHNKMWVDFVIETTQMIIDVDVIQNTLTNIYFKLNERLKIYDDINNGFNIINNIEYVVE